MDARPGCALRFLKDKAGATEAKSPASLAFFVLVDLAWDGAGLNGLVADCLLLCLRNWRLRARARFRREIEP